MQINYILLGQRIRAIRTKKGITQMELAERIDRSPAYMSYVETAYKFCSLDTLVRVANELNVSSLSHTTRSIRSGTTSERLRKRSRSRPERSIMVSRDTFSASMKGTTRPT